MFRTKIYEQYDHDDDHMDKSPHPDFKVSEWIKKNNADFETRFMKRELDENIEKEYLNRICQSDSTLEHETEGIVSFFVFS